MPGRYARASRHPIAPAERRDAAAPARWGVGAEARSRLVSKGVVRREDVRRMIDRLVSRTPADGARLIARAWVDWEFKERLLEDARAAALEVGLDPGPSPVVMAVENTEAVHNMVV